jgi:hypothetical protein
MKRLDDRCARIQLPQPQSQPCNVGAR